MCLIQRINCIAVCVYVYAHRQAERPAVRCSVAPPPLAREVNQTVKAVYRCLSAGIFSIFRGGGYIDSHKLKKVSPPVLGGLFFYRAYKCIIFFSWLYSLCRPVAVLGCFAAASVSPLRACIVCVTLCLCKPVRSYVYLLPQS